MIKHLKGLWVSLFLALACISLSSCGSKNDPTPNNGIQLKVSDIKVDIEISASKTFRYNLIATKGLEPNIYRDGKLVSQGNYSQDEYLPTKHLKTTLTHRGQALACALLISKVHSDEEEENFPIDIQFKVFQDGKLVSEYSQKRTLTNSDITEEVNWFSK